MSSRPAFHNKAAHGFTLLEVLIAVAIFSMISLGIFVSTRATFKARQIVQVEGDFYNGIRFAMELMNRDVMTMYTATVFMPEKKKKQTTLADNPFPQPTPTQDPDAIDPNEETARATQFFMPPTSKVGVRPTRFQGSRDKMSFVAASHSRIYKDSKESEFAKIRYELVRDDRKGAIQSTSILLKTETVNVWDDKDDEKDPTLKRYRLLPGIKSVKFRYCKLPSDSNELKCFDEWDSDREDFKNALPDVVEATIEVLGPERLTFSGVYKFRPEVPHRGLSPTI